MWGPNDDTAPGCQKARIDKESLLTVYLPPLILFVSLLHFAFRRVLCLREKRVIRDATHQWCI